LGVTFQPDILHEIAFSYDSDNYWYVLQWKDWYLKIQPYAVYDGKEYTLKQIVPFIKNQYPAVTYRQVVEKFAKYHRWGFWLEKLPPEISSKLNEVGYSLIDTNIPLSAFEFEHDPEMNVSRLSIGGKFTLDFSDIEARYDVSMDKQGIHVTGVRGLTDIDMDPITYSAPTITVTGTNAGAPWTFLDIYNADVAGGWGVVTKTSGDSQFQFNAKIVIGNNVLATTFTDTNKQIVFLAGLASPLIEVKNVAVLTLGQAFNVANKIGMYGCEIITLENTANTGIIQGQGTGTARADVYSTVFKAPYHNSATFYGIISMYPTTPVNMWGCVFDGATLYNIRADVYNCRILNSRYYGLLLPLSGTTMDIIYISNIPTADLYFAALTYTIRNVQSLVRTAFIRMHSTNGILYAIDCEPSQWLFTWGAINPIVYRQYTWNTLIKDNVGLPIQNANVTLIRADGTPAFTALTAADGTITEQTVTRGYYTQATGNTLNDYGPFTLEVIPPSGPLMKYIHKGIILDGPVDWEITLSPPPPAISKLVREFKPEEPPVPLEFVMSVEKLIRSHTKTKIGG